MNLPFINSVFTRLENNPVFEAMSKDVLGHNLPKTLIVRSSDERIDVAFNEAGNTLGFFAGGFALQWLVDKIPEEKGLKGVSVTRSKLWRQTGKSVALSSVLFAYMWALPFFRNYMTAVRTGTDDYTEIIGSRASGSAGDASSRLSSDSKQKRFEEQKESYLKSGFTTLAIGAGIAIASLLGAQMAIRRGVPIGKEMAKVLKTEADTLGEEVKQLIGRVGEWTRKTIGLKDGQFKKFGDIHAALFWGAPAYGGWIMASRNDYEKKEQMLKAVNFFVWFFALPTLIRRGFIKKYPQKLVQYIKNHNESNPSSKIKRVTKALIEDRAEGFKKISLSATDKAKAIKTWESQSLISILSSIVLLGVSPSVLNIWLTKSRIAEDEKHKDRAHFLENQPILPSGNLVKKPFESFVLQRPPGSRYNR